MRARITAAELDEPPSLVTFDVSFISLRLVLPAILPLAAGDAALVALIKPQFEAGRAHVRKGIVKDPAVHAAVCEDIAGLVASLAMDGGWHYCLSRIGRRREPRIPDRRPAWRLPRKS